MQRLLPEGLILPHIIVSNERRGLQIACLSQSHPDLEFSLSKIHLKKIHIILIFTPRLGKFQYKIPRFIPHHTLAHVDFPPLSLQLRFCSLLPVSQQSEKRGEAAVIEAQQVKPSPTLSAYLYSSELLHAHTL